MHPIDSGHFGNPLAPVHRRIHFHAKYGSTLGRNVTRTRSRGSLAPAPERYSELLLNVDPFLKNKFIYNGMRMMHNGDGSFRIHIKVVQTTVYCCSSSQVLIQVSTLQTGCITLVAVVSGFTSNS